MSGKLRNAALAGKNELALQKSGEIYRRIIDSTSDYISMINFSGRYVYVSPSHKQMGYGPDELIGKSAMALVCPQDRARLLPLLAKFAGKVLGSNVRTLPRIKKEAAKLRLNFQFRAKSGEWRALESIPSIVENPGGGYYVLLVSRDITEKKKAECALNAAIDAAKNEKAKTDAIIAAIGNGISIQDNDFRVLYQNSVHKSFVGDHKGEYCYKAFEHRNHVCEGCPIARSFKDGKVHTVERVLPGENRYFEITSSPLRDSTGRIIAGIEAARDVTARRRADEKIKESEARLSEAQKIAHIGNWSWNLKTNALYWSDENYRIFGMPQNVKPSVREFMRYVHPDDKKSVSKAIDDALHKRSPYDMDMRIITPDGALRMVNSRATVTFDKSGKPERMAGTVQDVTERYRVETELMKFKLGLERSPDAVFITDTEGNIVYVNPAFEKIYGYKKEEALGKTPRIIKSGLIHAEQYKQFWDTLIAKQIVAGEIVNKRKDGKLVPIEGSNNPILDAKGNITGFLAIHHDITLRKKAEDEIKLANERMEEAGTIAKFGRWDWDISTGALNWSNQVYALYGLDPKKDKPTYKTVVNKLIPEFRKEFLNAIDDALNNDKHFELESGIIRPDGTKRYTHTVGKVVRDKSGKPIKMFGVVQDITERKVADDAIKKANRELHEKVEELERFSKLTVGRELKMIELKNRIKDLEGNSGRGRRESSMVVVLFLAPR